MTGDVAPESPPVDPGAAMEALLDRIADLEQRLAGADERQEMFAQALDAFEGAVTEAAAMDVSALLHPAGEEQSTSEPEPLDMVRLYEWVQEHIGAWAQRKVLRSQGGSGGLRWCPWWDLHPEAVTRLEALRKSWTGFVKLKDPTAMTIYYRDFFDRTMEALMNETGPFHACSPAGHGKGDFVPIAPPPWERDSVPSAAETAAAPLGGEVNGVGAVNPYRKN
ncbi:DUF4913 domain-containing protein [Rhodococcus opacus]|uniref:DUF4913 domain-containing protein n=1 Tax=Rhodococcus opacus TaxID=37919 RepID=A0A2S8IW61_RHOOP|nr:DUF4913 domain-containing protein [Rhodococcus opacus]PQP19017.1 DUF4913 domain-containing protein [Rhodococcus opacus]